MTVFSVVMPMRNAAPFVEEALRSVLDQGVDLEVIVVDDGSTDGSADRVRALGDPRVRLVPGPQKGISASFNTGLAEARGEFVARCDADDRYAPERLAWQADWLRAHPEFGAVCGYYSAMDPHGRILARFHRQSEPADITEDLRGGTARTHFCAYAVRADVLRKAGGCRTWFASAEDIDLQFRLAGLGRVWFEPRPCYFYRLHEHSITHTQADTQRKFYEAAAREFAQQRRESGTDDLDRGAPPPLPEPGPGATSLLQDQIQGMLRSRAWKAWRLGNRREALSLGLQALRVRPGHAASWMNFLKLGVRCLLPGPAVKTQ